MRAEALWGTFASRPASADRLALLPGLIVVGAVCFNAGLAIVNGNVAGLTQAPVVVAEVTFVALAHAVALAHYRREMAPWYGLLGLFIAFAIVRSLSSQNIDVKYLRDVMIVPTFVVLGMTFDARRLGRIVVAIQVVMAVFLVLEAVNVDVYSNLLKIQSLRECYPTGRQFPQHRRPAPAVFDLSGAGVARQLLHGGVGLPVRLLART